MADVLDNPDFSTYNTILAGIAPNGRVDNHIMYMDGYPMEAMLFVVDGGGDSVNPAVQTNLLVNVIGGAVWDCTANAWLASAVVTRHATDASKAQITGTLVTAQSYLIYVFGVEVKRTAN